MPSVRFSRDKRGYEYVYLVHTPTKRGKLGRSRVLYWYRTPPGVRVGRKPFDLEVQRTLEQQNPGVTFDWEAIIATPMPPPDMTEFWRERRRAEKAARQDRRTADADESEEATPSEPARPAPPARPSDAEAPQHASAASDSVASDLDTTADSDQAPDSGAPSDGQPVLKKRRRRRGGRRRRVQDGETGAPTVDGADAERVTSASEDDQPDDPSEADDPTSEGE